MPLPRVGLQELRRKARNDLVYLLGHGLWIMSQFSASERVAFGIMFKGICMVGAIFMRFAECKVEPYLRPKNGMF